MCCKAKVICMHLESISEHINFEFATL